MLCRHHLVAGGTLEVQEIVAQARCGTENLVRSSFFFFFYNHSLCVTDRLEHGRLWAHRKDSKQNTSLAVAMFTPLINDALHFLDISASLGLFLTPCSLAHFHLSVKHFLRDPCGLVSPSSDIHMIHQPLLDFCCELRHLQCKWACVQYAT